MLQKTIFFSIFTLIMNAVEKKIKCIKKWYLINLFQHLIHIFQF